MPTTEPCALVPRFVGGELSPEESRAFQLHLAGCAQCQKELATLLQIDALAELGLGQGGPLHPPTPSMRWSSRTAVISAVVTLAAAGLLLMIYRGLVLPSSGRAPVQEVALTQIWEPKTGNVFLPRTTHPEADRFREGKRQMGQTPPSTLFPQEEFAQLLRKNAPLEIAAALLLWGRVDEAESLLAEARKSGLAESEDYWNTLAAIRIAQQRYQEALPLLAKVLQRKPSHTQAHWNRALALEALGLTLSAHREYDTVAQGEPAGSGWAAEARRRAEILDPDLKSESRWRNVLAVGDALVDAGTLPPAKLHLSDYAIARLYFYDAVRTRQSAEAVHALRSLAQELDPAGVLSRYTEDIAGRDFAKRAPLARQYKELWKTVRLHEPMTPQLTEAAAALLSSTEDDLAIGTAILLGQEREILRVLEERVAKLQDPWFEVLVRQYRAAVALFDEKPQEAAKWLGEALEYCSPEAIPYRCLAVKFDMANVQLILSELEAAQAHAEAGLKLARRVNEHGKGLQFIEQMAQVARHRNDVVVARAYLEEAAQRAQKDMSHQRHIHQTLANLALQELDFAWARQEMDLALATGEPLTLSGAIDLADITRHLPADGDEAALLRAKAAHREKASPAQLALWQHALGRFYLSRQHESGRSYLQNTLRELQRRSPKELERSQDQQRALAITYHELILDRGRQHDFAAALELFAQEQGFPAPARCAVAMTEETERSVIIVRGVTGEIWGSFEGDRRQRLPKDMAGVLPEEAVSMLRGCERVEVIARPPLHDRRNILPSDMAWSYRLRPEPLPPRAEGGRHLVVSEVQYREDRNRPKLLWTPVSGTGQELLFLRGLDAMPAQVLQAMVNATEIDLITHGGRDPASSSSYLLLAPEPSGDDRLTVTLLRQMANLKYAPFVIIAACEAGGTSPVYHEAVSLPALLLRKGARGVLAATVDLYDTEVNAFMNAVREQMDRGSPPAVALRDVRQRWLAEGKGKDWIDHVLLFE